MRKIAIILTTIVFISLSKPDLSLADFKDVSPSHPNFDAINYIQSKNIVSGYPDGTYKPENEINRAEFVKIITESVFSNKEIKACTKSPFKDVPNNVWYTPYVCIAAKNRIVNGYPDGTFKVANNINLVEAAKIIVNGFAYEVKTDTIWYKPFIEKLAGLNAIPMTFSHFEDKVTRGQMAEIIYRVLAQIKDKESNSYEKLKNSAVAKVFTPEEISKMAEVYYSELMKKHDEALSEYGILIALSDKGNLENDFVSLEKHRLSTIEFIKTKQNEIASSSSFQEDSTLRDALVKNLQTLIEMLKNEEKKLIELWAKMSKIEGDIPQNLINEENELLDTINEKGDGAYKVLHPIMTTFSEKYGFN